MKLFQRRRPKSSNNKSVVGHTPLWPPQRFNLRQYGLVVAGLLILAGGIVLFAASPASVPGSSAITISQGASRSLSPDFLGFNGDSSSAAWSNPALLPAISALKPETIRGIFGGTPSNYFNWQTGQPFIASNDPSISYIKPGWPTPPYTLSNYANALKAGGADAVFNINVMTYCPVDNANPASTSQAGASCTQAQACGPNPSQYTTSCTNTDETWGLNYQVAMLQAAKGMGVPIKYIELGNELYITGNPDYAYYFPSVQDYINKVNAWIPVLKQDFPGAQIAVVGSPPKSGVSAWNQAIYTGVHGEDAVTFHTYYGSTIPLGGSVTDPQDLSSMLSTSTENMISSLQTSDLASLPNGLSAWITEWNLASENSQIVHGSWAQGLTEANYALDLVRQPQVELADNHDLFSTQVYGSLFYSTSGYSTTAEAGKMIGTPSPLPTTQQFGMTGGGFALSALERSLHGTTSTTALNFSANPDIASTSVPGLMGQIFNENGKTNFYFVNLSAQDETINLGSLSGSYSMLQYTSSPANFVTGNSSIPATASTVTTTFTAPAYSVTSLVGAVVPSAASSSSLAPTASSPAASSSSGGSLSASGAKTGSSTSKAASAQAAASGEGNQVSLDLGGQTITVHSSLLKGVIASYKANRWLDAGTAALLLIPLAALLYAFNVPKTLLVGAGRFIFRLKG